MKTVNSLLKQHANPSHKDKDKTNVAFLSDLTDFHPLFNVIRDKAIIQTTENYLSQLYTVSVKTAACTQMLIMWDAVDVRKT